MLTPIPWISERVTDFGVKSLSDHLVFDKYARNFLKINKNVIDPFNFGDALSFGFIQIRLDNFEHISDSDNRQVRKICEFDFNQQGQIGISLIYVIFTFRTNPWVLPLPTALCLGVCAESKDGWILGGCEELLGPVLWQDHSWGDLVDFDQVNVALSKGKSLDMNFCAHLIKLIFVFHDLNNIFLDHFVT